MISLEEGGVSLAIACSILKKTKKKHGYLFA